MDLQYKAVTAAAVKVLSDEDGIVEAIVSVTGNEDDGGDTIQPGAYAKTLKARNPKGVHGHSWRDPVAKTLEAEELLPGDERLLAMLPDDQRAKFAKNGWGGLYIKGQYNLETQAGREAYSNVKFYGSESSWSIGYSTGPGDTKKRKDGGRDIISLELYEWSDVLFGMNNETVTAAVKSLQTKAFVVVSGSYEDIRRQLQDAVGTWATQVVGHRCHAYVEATFDDRVIVEIGHFDSDEHYVSGWWQTSYTLTDDGVDFGDPVDVGIEGVVSPKSADESQARHLVLAQRTFGLDPAALLGPATKESAPDPEPAPHPQEDTTVTTPDEPVAGEIPVEHVPNTPEEIPLPEKGLRVDPLVAEFEAFELVGL